MALVLSDRVQETASAPGTGAVSLLGAVTGYQTFSAGVGDGNTCYYCIADQGGSNWEVGIGTYSSSGNSLARTTPLSGSSSTPVNFASGTQSVFVTYPAEKSVNKDADGNVVIEAATNTGSALRITQTGTGNALVVEDSANPDSTPFVVDASGNVVIGATTSQFSFPLEIYTTTSKGIVFKESSADTNYNTFYFRKSRGTTPTSMDIVSNGDGLGAIYFQGTDGVNGWNAAGIVAAVDGVPGVNDMPGRLVFSTTADGASSPTERMRIDSAGRVGIGATPNAGEVLNVSKNPVGDGSGIGFTIRNYGTIQSSVTSTYYGNIVNVNTQAAAFTLSNLQYHTASQGTFGAGSSVTTQYGFHAASSLTGATNNYGFYSNIASGTGRWNFYASGTADNFFAGSVGIGESAIPRTQTALRINGAALTAADLFVVDQQTTIPSTATNSYSSFRSVATTSAAAFTLTSLNHFAAVQTSLGAGSAVTSQYGFNATSGLTGATNNYGFYSNIAAGTGRWNFYANGTAANYFAGSVSSASTIAAVGSATSSATLDPIGALELLYASGPYIDFKTSNVDFDCRIQQSNNGLGFQVGGNGSTFTAFNVKSNGNQDTYGTGEVFQAIYRNSAGATNNYVGNQTWWAKNASGTYVTQARLIVQQNSVTAGAETATVALQATKGGTPSNYIAFSGDTDTVIFSTNGGTERMRIDSAGNVVLKTGSLREVKTAIAASAIDLSAGNYFSKTISGTTTFTVSNVPASGTAIAFVLELTNGGSATVNLWSGVKWPGGAAPTLTASGKDILGFYTHDGGTVWNGFLLGKDEK